MLELIGLTKVTRTALVGLKLFKTTVGTITNLLLLLGINLVQKAEIKFTRINQSLSFHLLTLNNRRQILLKHYK